MTTTETTTTQQPDDEPIEASERVPFLQVSGTYPTRGDRFTRVDLTLNLNPSLDDGQPGDGRAEEWFTSFVTNVIAALRQPAMLPGPQDVVLHGGVTRLLAARMQHADGCNGSCGLDLPGADQPQPPRKETAEEVAARHARHQHTVARVYGRVDAHGSPTTDTDTGAAPAGDYDQGGTLPPGEPETVNSTDRSETVVAEKTGDA